MSDNNNESLVTKLCQECRRRRPVRDEKYCVGCRQRLLDRMKDDGYLQPVDNGPRGGYRPAGSYENQRETKYGVDHG